jgi:hypothetical protein
MINSTQQTLLFIVTIVCLNFANTVNAQALTGHELLEKAIKYHDPFNHWSLFKGKLTITMTMPEGAPSVSDVAIDLPEEYFSITARRDTTSATYTLQKSICTTSIKETPEEGERMPCETAALYKNYYTYLYGLPMKLKDDGTHISEVVERKSFKGKEYLVLKASYDEAVGSDVWYFYFNPETYAMEIYQFFKTENGAMKKDSGEYILLSELTSINKIKFPKIRAWYYNTDDKYLGTDTLN